MVIKVLEFVQQCSSYEDGNVIYELILPKVKAGEVVSLSFNGIFAVPSAFVNAAIVRLAEVVEVAQIKRCLKIVDSTKQINEMIRERIKFIENKP